MKSYILKRILRVLFIWLISSIAVISSAQLSFASTNVGGRISTNTTWTLAGSPYIVTSSVSVYGTPTQTAKLTIEPGVQVKFNANYIIQIGSGTNKGALYAVGTEASPIVFTSNKPSPARGDWDSIKFFDATDDALTAMAYCTVEYGGYNSTCGNVYFEKSAPTITNCTIRYSKYIGIGCNNGSPVITGGTIADNNTKGIYASGQSLITINSTSFSGNGSYAISQGANDELFSTQGITGSAGDRVEIRSGTVGRDQSWRNLGIPYMLSGNITIYKDATTAAKLTVEPGVQVKFNGNYFIAVGSGTYKGALYAVGTSSNPIVFTSNKPSPARGDWDSIKFFDATDDALTSMAYCTVEYGGSNSSNGNVYIQKSAPTITNCAIRYSKYVGIACSNGSPVITGGTIADNNTKGIYASGQSLITINSTSFSGNGSYVISQGADDELFSTQGITGSAGDRVEIRAGNIIRDQSWRNLGIPYSLSGNIMIYKDATTAAKLTIEPGVQARFNGNYSIIVSSGTYKGALYAVGTSSNPIVFTSDKPSPARGDWDSIRFPDATDDALTAMTYCTVEYGGSNSSNGNVYIQKSAPTITNCTIRYSKYVGIACSNGSPVITGGTIADNNTKGIYASGQSLITINSTSFSGNGSYAISQGADDELFSTQGITGSAGDRVEIRGGTIGRDQTWRNLGVSYTLSGSINVYKDLTTAAKLTIEPGVQVRFNGNYFIAIGSGAGGTLKGALYAVGTADHPILFTSDKPSPQPGDWNIISFYDATDDGLTEMTYCTVEYGGYYNSRGNIYVEKASPKITNSTIRYSKYNGIYCSYANPTIRFCSISNNVNGIYSSNSSPQVNHCNIFGNSQYGLDNISSDKIIDAKYNWWGHPSGPRGQGPGSGDAITNYVSYEAWLGLSFSYPYYISEGLTTTKQLTTNGGITYFYAKADDISNWTVLIKDVSQQAVRTLTESGKKIRQTWDGKDQSGQPLPAGTYFYQIQAQRQSDLSEATPLLGSIDIGPDFPIGFIFSPLPGNLIAETISIIGTASDPDFKDYILEYGQNPVPSTWVEIGHSTTSVTNGWLGIADLSNLSASYITFRLTVNDNSSHSTVSYFTCYLGAYHVHASPIFFSPNNDGKKDTTLVSAQFLVESDWNLAIKDPSGQNMIRTFTGSGNAMSQQWDGKNGSGEIQNSGIYPFVLTVSNSSLPEPDVVNGTIILDVIPPTVQITDPTEEELFSNIYGGSFLTEIFGTAIDGNFSDYKLEYGETYNPTTWNLIGDYSSAVSSGKLGELNNSQLTAGVYTIRLTVLDKADNQSSSLVHIRVGHLRLLLSSHQLNTAQSENMTITTEVPFDSTETIVIKDKNSVVRRILVDSLPRNSGMYNDSWDGKDNSGINVIQGAYYVVVTIIVAQDQKYFVLDLTDTGGVRRPLVGVDPAYSEFHLTYPLSFSPYEGEMAEFSFDLDAPLLVDLYVRDWLEDGWVRNLLKKEPLSSGSYSIYWDGMDDYGFFMDTAITGLFNSVIFWVYSLPDNGIIVYGERPEVTSLAANPTYFSPADEDFPNGLEISYSISKASNVNIYIKGISNSYIIKTMNLGTQTSGSHTIYWDGHGDNGALADPQAYRIKVVLTDSLGHTSLARYSLITLYY